MRFLLFTVLFIVACKPETEINFRAIKDSSVYCFNNSITVKQFIKTADSLECEGYRIVGNSENSLEDDYIVLARCKFPKEIKLIFYDGIQLPIYTCNGFRDYGINLCEDKKSNLNKLKEFYLNPTRVEINPSTPLNARLAIVADESSTIKSILPTLKLIKSMRDEIENGILSNLPVLFTFRTIQKDSMYIPTKLTPQMAFMLTP